MESAFSLKCTGQKVSFIVTDRLCTLLLLREDLYCGIVYVQPSNSRFYTPDEFARFGAEITSMCIEHNYVSLNGDFYSRIQNCADYVDADDFLTRYFEYDDLSLELYNTSIMFKQNPHF